MAFQHLHRPSSPTELSYTQLVKLAPPISQRRRSSNVGGVVGSNPRTPAAAAAAALASVPAMPDAPRTAPPASISVPFMRNPNARMERDIDLTAGGLRHQHQTPAHTFPSAAAMPMSAPLHTEIRPTMLPQQQRRPQNDMGNSNSLHLDDRVSSLAMKLQTMQSTPASSNQMNSCCPTLHHSQQ